MQELFTELLWKNEEISHAVACLCEDVPGYQAAQRECDEIVSQVQEIIGFELCDQLLTRLGECSRYEEYAYYAVGLGLRETIARALNL